jgi:hypothetical protein
MKTATLREFGLGTTLTLVDLLRGQHHPNSSRLNGPQKDRNALIRRELTLEDSVPPSKRASLHLYWFVRLETLRNQLEYPVHASVHQIMDDVFGNGAEFVARRNYLSHAANILHLVDGLLRESRKHVAREERGAQPGHSPKDGQGAFSNGRSISTVCRVSSL